MKALGHWSRYTKSPPPGPPCHKRRQGPATSTARGGEPGLPVIADASSLKTGLPAPGTRRPLDPPEFTTCGDTPWADRPIYVVNRGLLPACPFMSVIPAAANRAEYRPLFVVDVWRAPRPQLIGTAFSKARTRGGRRSIPF